jgi:hypothetical protein
MLHISKVGYKNLSHEIQFMNVHMQMIQLKGYLFDVNVIHNGWK